MRAGLEYNEGNRSIWVCTGGGSGWTLEKAAPKRRPGDPMTLTQWITEASGSALVEGQGWTPEKAAAKRSLGDSTTLTQ